MRYPVPGIGKPLGLVALPRDEEDASPRAREDHGARVPSPRWMRSSSNDLDDNCDLGDDDLDDLYAPYHGWKVHDGFVDETEAEKPHGKGHVETVKFISTEDRSNKRKRSPTRTNTMTSVFEEATSQTKTKKLTFQARMTVKPQEEWSEEFFNATIIPERLPLTIEQRVGKLEKYQKEELIHKDIVRYRLSKLEGNKDLKTMCEAFGKRFMELREGLHRCNARITHLEETNKLLWAALIRATAPCSPSPTRGTK